MRTKLKVDVSRAVLAAAATAAMLLAGAGLTGILSAQAPAAVKNKNAGETFKNVTTPALKA